MGRKRKSTLLFLASLTVVLLFVWSEKVTFNSKTASVLSNGRSIYLSLYAGGLTEAWAEVPFPRSSGFPSYRTSTDFFEMIVSTKVMNVSFAFFAAPGISPARTADIQDFTADNNAWCVVADLAADSQSTTPFLFTRNLAVDSLADTPRLENIPPFGKKAVVVVFSNGSGAILSEAEISQMFMNLGMTNKVLRP